MTLYQFHWIKLCSPFTKAQVITSNARDELSLYLLTYWTDDGWGRYRYILHTATEYSCCSTQSTLRLIATVNTVRIIAKYHST